jgi:hypothetical protein
MSTGPTVSLPVVLSELVEKKKQKPREGLVGRDCGLLNTWLGLSNRKKDEHSSPCSISDRPDPVSMAYSVSRTGGRSNLRST